MQCNGLSAGNSQMDARSARADRNCISYIHTYILAMCCDNLRSGIAISPEIAEAAGQVGNEAIRIGRDSEEGVDKNKSARQLNQCQGAWKWKQLQLSINGAKSKGRSRRKRRRDAEGTQRN